MKKKLSILLSLMCMCCLAAALLVGCSSSAEEEEEAEEYSTAEGTVLVLGFDADFPPFGYVGDDGEYTGFDLDLAAEACDRLGWELELSAIDWDSKDSLIESGTISCIWNGFTLEGREDQYTFTSAYYSNSQVILTKEDSGIESLEDLADKVVLAQVNSAAYDLLSDEGDQAELAATFASLETIADYNTGFMQLESGAVDAIAMDLPVAENLIADEEGYVILDEQLSTESYAVGFKLGNTAQAEAIEEVLVEMYEDGTVEEIAANYDAINMENWILTE